MYEIDSWNSKRDVKSTLYIKDAILNSNLNNLKIPKSKQLQHKLSN